MALPEPLQQIGRTFVRYRGRRLLYFAGCDYFRLASHSRVLAALKRAVDRLGLNVAASRLTTGNHVLYEKLERELARFFDAPAAVLVSTGYNGNIVLAQALEGSFSHALVDERSHPSLKDTAAVLNCPVLIFRHRDSEHLAVSVSRCGPECRPIVLTDGLFSHDGSTAPLRAYLDALPPDGRILVDDAHGAAVLGKHGRGTLEYCGASRARIFQTVTLSKGFGVYGGAILASAPIRNAILRRSRSFIGSTPLPLPLAAAALESLSLLKLHGSELRTRLRHRTRRLRARLRAVAFDVADNPGPIVPIQPASAAAARRIKDKLLRAGIFPPFIRYPGGPSAGYFRFVISSVHTDLQVDKLADALAP